MRILALLVLLLLGGCGSLTLSNGNVLTMHEKIGLTGSMQVTEETTADGEYVQHDVQIGPGLIPMATGAATPIAAARARRPSQRTTIVDVEANADAEAIGRDGPNPPGHDPDGPPGHRNDD